MASFRLALGPTAQPGPAEALQTGRGHQVGLAVSPAIGQLREIGREGFKRPRILAFHKVEVPGSVLEDLLHRRGAVLRRMAG